MTVTMTMPSPEREERRRKQKEIADRLKSSGALDDIFAKIDAGEPLTGEQGVLGGMLKAALERGLDTELTEHVEPARTFRGTLPFTRAVALSSATPTSSAIWQMWSNSGDLSTAAKFK